MQAKLLAYHDEDQVRWGGNDDPKKEGVELNKWYPLDHIEIHSQSSKVHLVDFPDKVFNCINWEYNPSDAWDTACKVWQAERGF